MIRPLGVFACSVLFFIATVPVLSQTPSRPRSPGEIAAADRIAMKKRATCQREARAKKLNFLQRRSFVKDCVRR
ncbi:MAG TPA: hypothetical protein VFP79_19935 [Pseudolabrys sp.]|nr:hypothetical protein [Pseudolabrys sp.]